MLDSTRQSYPNLQPAFLASRAFLAWWTQSTPHAPSHRTCLMCIYPHPPDSRWHVTNKHTSPFTQTPLSDDGRSRVPYTILACGGCALCSGSSCMANTVVDLLYYHRAVHCAHTCILCTWRARATSDPVDESYGLHPGGFFCPTIRFARPLPLSLAQRCRNCPCQQLLPV